jgi:hypothetical protein
MGSGPITAPLTFVALCGVRTSKRTDLGHFATAGGIELTKVQLRRAAWGQAGVETTDIGGSATAMINASPVNLVPCGGHNPTASRNLRGSRWFVNDLPPPCCRHWR